jgi:elongation factor P
VSGAARPDTGRPASHRPPGQFTDGEIDVTTSNDLKNGMTLNIDGELWTVVKFQHVNPGKGAAFVRTSLRNVLTGKVLARTFNAGVRVETATVDKRKMQFLYRDGDHYVFMDSETFDQLHIPEATVGDAANFMLESQDVTVAVHEETPLFVELPPSANLEITFTEPGLQGDRSSGGTKPATLSTGYQIQVPLFLKTGDRVKVDTRTGDYLGKATGE